MPVRPANPYKYTKYKPATIVRKYAKFSAKTLGSITNKPSKPEPITANIRIKLNLVHLIKFNLFASGISLGFLPASPSKCLNLIYWYTPKTMPTPAAPKP